MADKGPATQLIDVNGATVIPGLNDSHTHLIRGGLNYSLELRWDGIPSLSEALERLKEQARQTPTPHWVRVVGGWSEFQFAERRMPTLDEINATAPHTPVFVLHLYDRACATLLLDISTTAGASTGFPIPPTTLLSLPNLGGLTGFSVVASSAAGSASLSYLASR
jgi:Amidohydrolase family